jgi:hypothetical protein
MAWKTSLRLTESATLMPVLMDALTLAKVNRHPSVQLLKVPDDEELPVLTEFAMLASVPKKTDVP